MKILPLVDVEPFAPHSDRYPPRLLTRFPGAKSPHKYPVHDGGDYDAWIAPYAGSGVQEARLAHAYPKTHIFTGDIDPGVAAVWRCWGDDRARAEVSRLVREWQQQIIEYPGTFELLRTRFNLLSRGLWAEKATHMAAASILLRRITFGGVVRFNKPGTALNICASQGQLAALPNWEFLWPAAPRHLTFSSHWEGTISAFEASDCHSAIALVDPPYYAPGNGPRVNGGMSPCYPGHVPTDDQVYWDCLAIVRRLIGNPRVKRIVMTNYWGECPNSGEAVAYPIVGAMQAICEAHGRLYWFSDYGPLTDMNKGNGENKTLRLEGVWEIGGRRQFRDRVWNAKPPQQASIFDLLGA